MKMKLYWCCLVTALMTVSRGAVDVEKTVKQVQSILQANSHLPRLSRDEILQLLNDIRAEDAKKNISKESKEELISTAHTKSIIEIEVKPVTHTPNIEENIVSFEKDIGVSASSQSKSVEATTQKGPKLMVVLPYTPRDGSSLQELYTRPPRVEVVQAPATIIKPDTDGDEKIKNTLIQNAKLADKQKDTIPEELQAFLDAHGLSGKPGEDNSFLLPLEGFKPLPPAKVVDGTIQLPENILLTYDLISSGIDTKSNGDTSNNFLYEPLRPELPFELDTSSSEIKETKFPYDMPKQNPKSQPNYQPIDYDSVKVIPLKPIKQVLNPLDEPINTSNEQSKRQAESSSETSTTKKVETTTVTDAPKTNQPPAEDSSVSADTQDKGASIADLEESFGGAAPSQPGDAQLPPPRKNGFYWMLDWNSFLEVGDGDTKVNIRFEPKLGDPQMFLPVSVP